MKISNYIKYSLDAADNRDLELAMMLACSAIDGTAKKMYPSIATVGKRYKKFIVEYLDIIELIYGGVNLKDTVFPFKNNKGIKGIKFEDIVYEKFRCNLAHADELPKGYGINVKIADGIQMFEVDIENQAVTFPESVIFALGLACVLAPVNADQKIGDDAYFYHDSLSNFVVDHWWGKVDSAKEILDFKNQIRVKFEFPHSMQQK